MIITNQLKTQVLPKLQWQQRNITSSPPQFKSQSLKYTNLTDFNDLVKLEGINELKKQLSIKVNKHLLMNYVSKTSKNHKKDIIINNNRQDNNQTKNQNRINLGRQIDI